MKTTRESSPIDRLASGIWSILSSVQVGISLLLTLGVLAVFVLLRYASPEPHFLQPAYLGLVGAFGLNIACVLISRYRFRAAQTGFLMTHVGIVTAIVGGALTHWWGEDGQMRIVEGGEASSFMIERMDGMYKVRELRVGTREGSKDVRRFDVEPPARLPAYTVPAMGLHVQVLEYLPRAARERRAEAVAGGAPALRFRLGMAVASVEDWLQADLPGLASREIGNGLSVHYRRVAGRVDEAWFASAQAAASGRGSLVVTVDGREAVLPLEPLGVDRAVSGVSLKVLAFYPDFVMREPGRYATRSDRPENPAVEVEVTREGERFRCVLFARHPGMSASSWDGHGISVAYRWAGLPEDKSVTFVEGEDGSLGVVESNGKGRHAFHAAPAPGGEPVPCVLSPLKVSVLERLPSAVLLSGFVPSPQGDEEALRLRLSAAGESREAWVSWGEPVSVGLGDDPVFLMLTDPERDLGFTLHLDDFRKVDYEGSAIPMSFESHVRLEDPAAGIRDRPFNIHMNEPLIHKGWTFFQSAFESPDVPGAPQTTILQASRDPGKPVVYTGSVLIVSGVLFMFYLKPWLKKRGWL